jgi:DNA polymerase III subunit epsilon
LVAGIQQSFDDLGIPLIEVEFVVLDFETTGGSPGDDRITEVGASRSAAARSSAPSTPWSAPASPSRR